MIGLMFVGVEFGLVVLVLVLLNVRDRRRERLVAVVLGACGPLRDCFGLHVHAPLWSRRTLAILDMLDTPPCVGVEVWPMTRSGPGVWEQQTKCGDLPGLFIVTRWT